jgi:hypothetical protein
MVMVYHQVTPQKLPTGPILVIDPQRQTDLWAVKPPARGIGPVRPAKPGGPLQNIAWDLVIFESAASLRFSQPAQILAAGERGQPMVTLIERPGGNILVLHAQLDQTDLHLDPAFDQFLRGAIHWLADVNHEGDGSRRADHELATLRESDLRPEEDIRWTSPPAAALSRPLFDSVAMALVGLMVVSLSLEPIVMSFSASMCGMNRLNRRQS